MATRNVNLERLGTFQLLVRCDLGYGDDERARGREEIILEVYTTDKGEDIL